MCVICDFVPCGYNHSNGSDLIQIRRRMDGLIIVLFIRPYLVFEDLQNGYPPHDRQRTRTFPSPVSAQGIADGICVRHYSCLLKSALRDDARRSVPDLHGILPS